MRRHTLSILAFSLAAVAAQADVITITRSGDVLDVDSTTGASHVLFATHLQVNCLAATGGTYHTVSNGKFYRINLNNQTATVGATVDVPGDVRGLAIDGAGRVWAIIDDGGVDSLWTLNLSTGQGTLLGPTGFNSIQGLDCDSQGRLFAYDLQQGLIRVNRRNGVAWDVDADTPAGANLQSIAFDDNDVLYGADDKLYRIKPNSGSLTLVGGSLGDVRGIEIPTSPLYNVIPQSVAIRLGKAEVLVAGLVREDEGEGLVVCRFVVPNASTPPIQVEVTGHSPFSLLDGMQIRIRQRMNASGLYKAFIDVKDYQTGLFVNKADLAVGSNFKTDVVNVTGFLDAYVGGSGEITMRYRVRATGPTAVLLYCNEMDHVAWFLTPRIL